MDYRMLIMKLVRELKDEELLRRIYYFIKYQI